MLLHQIFLFSKSVTILDRVNAAYVLENVSYGAPGTDGKLVEGKS